MPGFGMKDQFARDASAYTFENFTKVIARFTEVLGLKNYPGLHGCASARWLRFRCKAMMEDCRTDLLRTAAPIHASTLEIEPKLVASGVRSR